MNEIKFKGKRADNQEWVYGYYAFIDGFAFIIETNATYEYIEPYDTISGMVEVDKNTIEMIEIDEHYFNRFK